MSVVTPVASPGNGQDAGWKAVFPPALWLPGYQARWLRADALAGVTLAAYAIPVALAYAGLAGLPPQVGLYGYLLGGVGYGLFGSSRHLAVGPTSAISLMVGGTIAQLAGVRMLARLNDELAKQHVSLRLAEVHATSRDLLRGEGLEAKVGSIDRFTSVADAVEAFQRAA